jgi:KaiC/GvpD/RAD55 family RecA-like ATPase
MDRDNTLKIYDSEKLTFKAVKNFVQVKSNFQFLIAHNGFRLGKMHLIMGTAGSGKTTLIKSLIMDFMKMNPDDRMLIYLSEESKKSFKYEMAEIKDSLVNADKIHLISEIDESFTNERQLLAYMEMQISEIKPKLFIIDNITTSDFYNDKKASQQADLIKKLKAMFNKTEAACLLVAHTGANVSDNMGRLINENDIRGSKTIVNLLEFMYILQRFELGSRFFPTLRTVKHRGQNPDFRLVKLNFDINERRFLSDTAISFKDFKEVYKQRNVF